MNVTPSGAGSREHRNPNTDVALKRLEGLLQKRQLFVSQASRNSAGSTAVAFRYTEK